MATNDAILTAEDAGPTFDQLVQIKRAIAELQRAYARGRREGADEVPPTVTAVLKRLGELGRN